VYLCSKTKANETMNQFLVPVSESILEMVQYRDVVV